MGCGSSLRTQTPDRVVNSREATTAPSTRRRVIPLCCGLGCLLLGGNAARREVDCSSASNRGDPDHSFRFPGYGTHGSLRSRIRFFLTGA